LNVEYQWKFRNLQVSSTASTTISASKTIPSGSIDGLNMNGYIEITLQIYPKKSST